MYRAGLGSKGTAATDRSYTIAIAMPGAGL